MIYRLRRCMLLPETDRYTHGRRRAWKMESGVRVMNKTAVELACKVTTGEAWVLCPVCRRGKLLKLTEETRAQGLVLFCRSCKHESVVEIGPEKAGTQGLPRVWLSAGGLGIPPSLGGDRKGALWTGGAAFSDGGNIGRGGKRR